MTLQYIKTVNIEKISKINGHESQVYRNLANLFGTFNKQYAGFYNR